jgi:hypothetical protein
MGEKRVQMEIGPTYMGNDEDDEEDNECIMMRMMMKMIKKITKLHHHHFHPFPRRGQSPFVSKKDKFFSIWKD